MRKFRYKNLFIYGSLQFSGNMEEYFSKNTEKLVVFIVMPRIKNKFNIVRLYKKGKLVEEKKAWSSENRFLYYASWYLYQLIFMFRYFSKEEQFTAIYGHPLSFFGMGLQKLARKVTFVYGVGDYYPGINLPLRLFQRLKKFYHDRIPYSYYLSDEVNKEMNGRILNTAHRKTIMWGVKPKNIQRDFSKTKYNLLFVGLIKTGQGLELVFDFLKLHKNYSLKIIGVSHEGWFEKCQKIIKSYGISKQVYYPDRFFSDQELDEVSKECFIGVAPYTTEKTNASYYADPGKVKVYAEMGLPVIMSKTTSIAPYIKKFQAGEIIKRDVKSFYQAVEKIKHNYQFYLKGLKNFNQYFYYQEYYHKAFKFIEDIESADVK